MPINNSGQINIATNLTAFQVFTSPHVKELPHIMSPKPLPNTPYIARTHEEDMILMQLSQKKLLLLTGLGGVGKSSIAQSIFNRLQNHCTHIAWIPYSVSLRESFRRALFQSCFSSDDDREDFFCSFEKQLTNLPSTENGSPQHTVLIIDNFNNINAEELALLQRLPAEILITTRDICEDVAYYELNPPDEKFCEALFCAHYSNGQPLRYTQQRAVNAIVKLSHCYPLALQLIAQNIREMKIPIEAFLQSLKQKHFEIPRLCDFDESTSTDRIYQTVCQELQKVYLLSNLSEPQSTLLKLCSLLPSNQVISTTDFELFLPKSPIPVTDLLRLLSLRGWIHFAETGYFMHEVVCGTIYMFQDISYTMCLPLLNTLESRTTVLPHTDLQQALWYGECALNVLHIMHRNLQFCRHPYAKEAAVALKEAGQVQSSCEILDMILPYFHEDSIADKPILAELYNNYSKVCSIQDDRENAFKYALRAEQLIDQLPDALSSHPVQLMVIKKTVSMQYMHAKQYETALLKMDDALTCSSSIPSQSRYLLASLYSDYATLLSTVGRITDSIQTYHKSLDIYQECGLQPNSPWRFTTFTNLSDSLFWNAENICANDYAFQALIGKCQTYTKENLPIGNAYLSMARIYSTEKKLWDVSALFYQKALKFFHKIPGSDGHCESLAGLSLMKQSCTYAINSYKLMLLNSQKVYRINTYLIVMKALMPYAPDKVIEIGTRLFHDYNVQNAPHSALQYAALLMTQSCLTLHGIEDAKLYLAKSEQFSQPDVQYYSHAAQEILNSLDSF